MEETNGIFGTVRSRWRRIDAELIAYPLVDARGFARAELNVQECNVIEALRRHLFFKSDLARYARFREDHQPEGGGGAPPDPSRSVPIWRWLGYHVRRLLICEGTHMRLRPEHTDPGGELLRWRWLSLRIPPTILIGAATEAGSIPPARVRILDPSIAPASPVALLHVHWGPLMPFEHRWQSLRYRLASRNALVDDRGLHRIRTVEPPSLVLSTDDGGQPGRYWERALHLALVARELLWLHAGRGDPIVRNCSWDPRLRWLASGDIAHRRTTLPGIPRFIASRIIRDFRARIEQTSRNVDYAAGRGSPPTLDPASDETRFMRRCFDHLATLDAQNGDGDPLFTALFTQYLRVKTALYQHMVVDPDASGLDAFVAVDKREEMYGRVAACDDADDDARLRASREDPPLDVRQADIRVSVSRAIRLTGNMERLRARSVGPGQNSLVASLNRASGTTLLPQKPRRPLVETWQQLHAERKRLEHLFRVRARVLGFVRALDLMGRERDGPLWLALPHIRALRETSRREAGRVPLADVEPLKLTLHAGEDFGHLLTGLRAVHEPFAWRLMMRGDRLGHARALGKRVESWIKRHPWVQMKPWDRLLDMGWVCECRHRYQADWCQSDWQSLDMEYLREQARHCLAKLGANTGDDPLDTARKLWISIGKRWTLPSLGLPTGLRHEPKETHLRLLYRYLFNVSMHEQAEASSVAVESAPDRDVMLVMQDLVRRQLSRWQTVIEVNPSSNLFVGAQAAILNQPMFQLRPTGPGGKPALCIAISTDDPLTFATCLSDEFAYAWAGMVVDGQVEPSHARQWLEDAAVTSLRARF